MVVWRAMAETQEEALVQRSESERLPEDERSGSVLSLGAIWAGVLLAPGTIITGMVAAGGSAGPGFVYGFLGLAIGVIIGVLAVALISTWGPRTGMAQMPLGRLAFGRFNFVPQIFLVFSLIAYNCLSDLFGVDALADALGVPFGVALGAIVALEITVVLFGVSVMRKLGLVISSVMFIIIIFLVIGVADVPAAPAPPGSSGVPTGQLLVAVALGFSGSISWTVQASDLSRTLPATSSSRKLFAVVFFSMSAPLLLLGGIGAWASTSAALNDPMGRVETLLGGGAPAVIALLVLGMSLATANGFNDFSGGLSLVQMGVKLSRPKASLIITFSALGLALIARGTQLGQLTSDIVLIAGYYTTPWFGVVIVELLARRNDSAPWLTPAMKAKPAVISFLLGFILLLPFSATPVGNKIAAASPAFSWIGWVSRNLLSSGGLGYVVGVLAGALIYLLLRRIAAGPAAAQA